MIVTQEVNDCRSCNYSWFDSDWCSSSFKCKAHNDRSFDSGNMSNIPDWCKFKKDRVNTGIVKDPAFFDVDDTLVLFNREESAYGKPDGKTICGYTSSEEDYWRHEGHIQALIDHKAEGHFIIVWSQGGAEHARRSIEELGLTGQVDLYMTKPWSYYDDKPITNFMTHQIWTNPLESKFIQWEAMLKSDQMNSAQAADFMDNHPDFAKWYINRNLKPVTKAPSLKKQVAKIREERLNG